MAIDDKIRDEKLQNDINREDAKISALSSGKSDRFEYLTGKEILHPSQSRLIEQAKFTYSPLGKALEKKKTSRCFEVFKPFQWNKRIKKNWDYISKNKLRDLIIDKLKNIIQLQNNSKLDDIEYNTKRGKCYNTGKYSLFIVFLKCTWTKFVIKNVDEVQS